ncbi:MAG: hypothetical protein ABL993_09110 [Vicinamibacterales bacterium]
MGRKPIDYQQLDLWDAEWYLAFYRLSEGGELPLRTNQWWNRRQIGSSIPERLTMLKRMSLEQYWAYSLAEVPRLSVEELPLLSQNREHAEKRRADEIASLTRWADPVAIQQRHKGFEIWQALGKARTAVAVTQACQRWIAFGPDPVFPTHLLAMTAQFLAMRRDRRFPQSPTANEARLTYIAAGMAGACVGISPLTAIHRVRTLKHEPGGPLWNQNTQQCDCWRCDRAREMKAFDAVVDAARKAGSP